jgi:glycosyltransferase involved in cell wall biosynthesis
VDVVVEHVARFAAREAPDLRLVLIGRGSYRVPRAYRDAVLELGYVSEAEKRALFAEAVALVNPSELESLSVVLLEAWREGTPALVAAGSDVMAEHCARSGAGLTFAGADEFDRALRRLLDDPDAARAMGAAGRDYVLGAYGWPMVRDRFRSVVERLVGTRGRSFAR